jgi:NADH-quinone oxidoreductase subunit F
VNAIKGGKRLVHVIDQATCIRCGTCREVCPAKFSAVEKVSGKPIKAPKEPIPVKV